MQQGERGRGGVAHPSHSRRPADLADGQHHHYANKTEPRTYGMPRNKTHAPFKHPLRRVPGRAGQSVGGGQRGLAWKQAVCR